MEKHIFNIEVEVRSIYDSIREHFEDASDLYLKVTPSLFKSHIRVHLKVLDAILIGAFSLPSTLRLSAMLALTQSLVVDGTIGKEEYETLRKPLAKILGYDENSAACQPECDHDCANCDQGKVIAEALRSMAEKKGRH